MLQYAALTYSRIHASALPLLPLSSNGFASRSLVARFMSPGCKQSGEKEYEEASKNRSSDERMTFDKNPSSERAPSAKRRRAAAAAATMCPMISRRRSLEFELCRTAAAASPANPERCTSATTSPATVLTSESAVEEEKTGKTEVRKREEGGGAAGGDSFNRGELRVGVELDAPFSREGNPRSELWLVLLPSLPLVDSTLHSIALSRLRR